MSHSSTLARFRHLPSSPRKSQTATGTPRSPSAATMFEPMNPAPPVTKIIGGSRVRAPASAGCGDGVSKIAVVIESPGWLPGWPGHWFRGEHFDQHARPFRDVFRGFPVDVECLAAV